MTDSALFTQLPTIPVTALDLPVFNEKKVQVNLLRLDLTHPQISGNKWFKLKYNILKAQAEGYRSLLSFGGAYSNHIHALAWTAKEMELPVTGIIRGEPEYADNPTLSDAVKWGMSLKFVNRETYRKRADQTYLEELISEIPESLQPVYLIPEGGSNELAVRGCKEIISPEILQQVNPDVLVLPCGTGGTIAGLAVANPDRKVLGIPVLKKAEFLCEDIRQLIAQAGEGDVGNWELDLDGHCGGYAKITPELMHFMEEIESSTGIQLDQVYTAKMLYRLVQLVANEHFLEGTRILAIHTGGVQGRRSVYGVDPQSS